ncbi:MAG: peptidylprolyl isomerase [Rhodoferax sp.]|jgi:peptidyl-prolyl cis-trans isomerase SurA|nr:peptidylprolyl isomerase [Rhodoferax sp.]
MNSGYMRPALLATLIVLGHLPVQAQGLRLPGGSAPVAAGTPPSSQRASDYIVAVVNSEPITNLQVRQEMQRMAQFLSQQQQPIPSAELLGEQALERLISDRTQIQFARESGIRVEEFAIDEAEQSIARQNQVDTAEMYRRLSADGISRAQFRSNLRDQMLLSRVREREVGQRIKVSELDIDRYLLDQQRESGGALADVNIAHILLALPESATPAQVAAAQAKAQQIIEKVRAGEDFSKLARELSQAPDAAEGGVFGLRPVDRYPQLFVDAVQNLQPGAMTTVRSGAGLHVLRLIEKRSAGGPATSVSQTRARHILLRPTAALSEAAATAKLAELRQKIVSGQISFEAAAKEFSQDSSAAQGGDLGWAVPGQFVPEFEGAMEKLQPGDISPPLVSRFGVHLIQVQERRTTALSAREQREAVRALLREKKYDEAYLSWSRELRARAYVDMREPPG